MIGGVIPDENMWKRFPGLALEHERAPGGGYSAAVLSDRSALFEATASTTSNVAS